LVFDVAPPRRDPWRRAASACSRGRLEATAAVLTGAASVSTTERLLRMWSAPPVEPLPDLLALPSTSGMTRGINTLWFHGAESRPLGSALHAPGRLGIMCALMCRQHGRARCRQRWLHGVTTRAGWPTGDDRQSRVRAGLSLPRVLPAAPVAWLGWRPPGAPWCCEMNAGAASPWDFLHTGASVWWLSCCSAIRLPACSPGASLAFWATQVGYVVHPG